MSKPFYRVDKPIGIENSRRYRIINTIIVIVFVSIGGILAYLILDLNNINNPNVKSARGATIVQRIAGPKTFKSAYFEFSDTNNWEYAPNDSTSNKLTYLLYNGGTPESSLTVYVNQTPVNDDLVATRVLPVSIVGDDSLSVGDISVTCGSLYGSEPKVVKTVSIGGTNFLCVPDSPEYLVIAGQTGGSYILSLRRSNGQMANYIIIYRDLSVNPNPQPFIDVMQTFKAL
jgi:hypothetical protein